MRRTVRLSWLVTVLALASGCPLYGTIGPRGVRVGDTTGALPPTAPTCLVGTVWRAGSIAAPVSGASLRLSRDGSSPVEDVTKTNGAFRLCPDWRVPSGAISTLTGSLSVSAPGLVSRTQVVALADGRDSGLDVTLEPSAP